MDIEGKRILVLGGYGLVGMAVCRELLAHAPARLIVASLRKDQAIEAVEQLQAEFPDSTTKILPVWGDLLLRAEWQDAPAGTHPRTVVLADPEKRRRLVGDILEELNDDILFSSLLYGLITGKIPGPETEPADVVIDCVNTATAFAYQNIYQTAQRLEGLIDKQAPVDWPEEIERLLASLYVPQLVRHVQIFYEAMLQAETQAYIKIGTSGTGGMGLNIPYTHGEEKPSRVLLSKSAIAGAQTMLIFLLARTPGGPAIVKEIKPTAAIAWKDINFGTIRGGGRDFPLYDCPPEAAYPLNHHNISPVGDFGIAAGGKLQSVYIDTGENGLFALGEFTAITTLGQMQFVTPEEIAQDTVRELMGGNTGRDIIAGLDGAVMGPTYRAGFLREAAIRRMELLQEEHGVDSIAFELLGPPRLSKFLFEAYLFQRECRSLSDAIETPTDELAERLEALVLNDADLRQQIISVGIPILLRDGERLLRGPLNKSPDAENGWVDLRDANIQRWQTRLSQIQDHIAEVLASPASSTHDRVFSATQNWAVDNRFNVGEIVGWLLIHEERGRRGKE